MFINIPLRHCKCDISQDVNESRGTKGQRQSKNKASFSALGDSPCRESMQRGYGSAAHGHRDRRHGPCSWARATFLPLSSVSLTKCTGDWEKACICFSFHFSINRLSNLQLSCSPDYAWLFSFKAFQIVKHGKYSSKHLRKPWPSEISQTCLLLDLLISLLETFQTFI